MTTANAVSPSLGTDIETVPHNLFTMGLDALRDYDYRLHNMGTKDHPIYMDDVQVHPDSLAVEYAICTPARDPLDFISAVRDAHQTAERMIGTRLVGTDYVDIDEIVHLTEETTPFLWENARVFGCSPDWIVLPNGKPFLRANVPASVKHRSLKEIGCHIHFTLPEHMRPPVIIYDDNREAYDGSDLAPVVREWYERTDWLHQWSHPIERPWYRKPMTYRPKSYGFEYRSFGASLVSDLPALERVAALAFEFMEDCFSGRVSI